MPDPAAYERLRAKIHERQPRVAVILGSGLGELADRLHDARTVPFLDIPGLTETTVPGHKGRLIQGDWAGVPVLVFSGRLHLYEGHAQRRITQPVQLAHEFGVEVLIATNAAGGIRDDLAPGTLMALTDHFTWTTPNCWREPGPGGLGSTRASPYEAPLRELLQNAARRIGTDLPAGVYAQVTGPCYETKAEIRALRTCGADAVGMSTAREVQAARDLGLRCIAISCITNRAAGLGTGPIHHDEVLENMNSMRERLGLLLETFLSSL